jgi:hypothetical protein
MNWTLPLTLPLTVSLTLGVQHLLDRLYGGFAVAIGFTRASTGLVLTPRPGLKVAWTKDDRFVVIVRHTAVQWNKASDAAKAAAGAGGGGGGAGSGLDANTTPAQRRWQDVMRLGGLGPGAGRKGEGPPAPLESLQRKVAEALGQLATLRLATVTASGGGAAAAAAAVSGASL